MDAAVAVGFALAVTLPRAGNIGGGGFMLYFDAASGETTAIDYREMAPLLATRDMFLDEDGNADPMIMACRYFCAPRIDFVSRNSAKPCAPHSRPLPDCL